MEYSLSDEPTTDITSKFNVTSYSTHIEPCGRMGYIPPTHCNEFISFSLPDNHQPQPHFRGTMRTLFEKRSRTASAWLAGPNGTPRNAIDTTHDLLCMTLVAHTERDRRKPIPSKYL